MPDMVLTMSSLSPPPIVMEPYVLLSNGDAGVDGVFICESENASSDRSMFVTSESRVTWRAGSERSCESR